MTGAPPFDLKARAEEARLDEAVKQERARQHAREVVAQERTNDGYEIALTAYSDIESKLTRWAWDGRIPEGCLVPLVGTEGLGKSAVGFALASKLTHGTLPGDLCGTPVNVAILTPEDDPARVNKPRLLAAGADLSRVFQMSMRKNATSERGLSLPDDTDKITRALIEADVKFVFPDPLVSMLDPRLNSWKDTDVRKAFEPIVAVLAEHEITMLGPIHTNKTQSTDARQRVMGSAGWQQLARAVLLVGLDPDDPDGKDGPARCIALTKHNYGPPARTMRFTLLSTPVQVESETRDVVRSELGELCDVKPNAMLAHEQGHEDAGETKEDRATKWLRGFLEDGPRARQMIEDAAEGAGHTWRTIERAKKDLGAKSFQPGGTRDGGWSWRLVDGIEI